MAAIVVRRIPVDHAKRIQIQNAAAAVLESFIPAGTLGWLAQPSRGETRRSYAERVVYTAAARSSWAGGLVDGTHAYDAASIVAAEKATS